MDTVMVMSNETLKTEIAAFNRDFKDLLAHFQGKFVVYHDDKRFGSFDSFDTAAEAALKTFGRKPFLIRQVMADQPHSYLPSSLAYRPVHYAQA